MNDTEKEEDPRYLAAWSNVSLRDWFASQEGEIQEDVSWELCEALAGPRPKESEKTHPIKWLEWRSLWQAKVKFIRADAMLAARKEGV